MILHLKEQRTIFLTMASLCLLTLGIAMAGDYEREQERVRESGNVMKELVDSPSGVPISVLNKAECVIVLPAVKKAGFIVGASYGRGVMTCRRGENFNGRWSAPTMMQSMGGSFGLQAGGQATDFVVLVMNDKGARALMKGKAKLGADASIAAGPVGRDAEASTNAAMSAEMLSYSRAQGVFAGVSLSGTSLGPDDERTKRSMARKWMPRESSAAVQARHQNRLRNCSRSSRRNRLRTSQRESDSVFWEIVVSARRSDLAAGTGE
jgi:SH3 domain-containing YSC84-like protein 1